MRVRRFVIIMGLFLALSAALCIGGGELAAVLIKRDQPAPATPAGAGAVAHLRAQGELEPCRWAELGLTGSGILAELSIAPGQAVQAGQVLARLDPVPLQRQVAAAQAALAAAQARLEQLQAGPSPVDLALAQVDLARAESDLEQLTAGPLGSELAAARAAVQAAERELANARQDLVVVQKSDVVAKNVRDREYEYSWFEANYGEYKKKFERGEIDQNRLDLEWNALLTAKERLEAARAEAALALGEANDRLARAQETLNQARARLVELTRTPDAPDLEVAQLAYERAQAQWAQLTDGPDQAAVAEAQAAVESAQLALEVAQANLAASLVSAPFAATVTAVDARPGELVGAEPFLTVADLTAWQVRTVDVDEWAVARIQLGQPVTVTLPALEQEALAGIVTEIAARAESAGGAEAFFPVVVTLSQADPALRWGMTARLDFGPEP